MGAYKRKKAPKERALQNTYIYLKKHPSGRFFVKIKILNICIGVNAMLLNHNQSSLSFHSELYSFVPEDHFLRRVHELVDFSFINDLVKESYCTYYGRPANEPELLFRLLFLQFLYNLSDERVIEDSQYNLAYKWFLGLNPEDTLPDSSQLSRFRVHRLGANRVEKVLEHIVKQCLEKGLIQSKALIIDSTHTIANASKDKPLDVLKKAANRLLKGVKKQYSGLYKKLPIFPKLEGTDEEKAKQLLEYLVELKDLLEEKLPDAEGSLLEKINIVKQIVEDERLLLIKGLLLLLTQMHVLEENLSRELFMDIKTTLL
jgi:transposase